MAVKRNIDHVRALRRKGEVKTNTDMLSKIHLERGQQIPPKDAVQIRTAAERVLMEDPRSLVFLVGGAARMYRGQQPAFRDIDLAVVTSKGPFYQKMSKGTKQYRKFMQELTDLAGRKVDVIGYKRQHFKKPTNILNQLAIEKEQKLFAIHMLANGIPLYNTRRAQNFQNNLRAYLPINYEKRDVEKVEKWHIGRSLTGLQEEAFRGKRDLGGLIGAYREQVGIKARLKRKRR
jgi:predicted nucleotidyltransferase